MHVISRIILLIAFGTQVSAARDIINLDDGAVGRGLCRPMYRTMLERAAELGIERYRGTTWNPAVIHLARSLERRLAGWCLRTQGPFISNQLLRALDGQR